MVSQTGLVYTFTTPKLEAVVKQPEGRNLIQECLNAPDPADLATNQAEAGPSSTPFQRDSEFASADIVDEQDDEEEEEKHARSNTQGQDDDDDDDLDWD